jgi:hypothetical protein
MPAFQKKDSRNAVKAANAPFCKVCHDAGKPESEYTSHFVKSAPSIDGVVVCPTLLSQQCGYCHTAGHTVSYCKLLKQHQKAKEHYNRKSEFLESKTKAAVPATKQPTSVFAALAEDSDDEIDAEVVKQACAFPALCEIKHVQESKGISYAVMASKPACAEAALPMPKKTKTKTIVTHDVRRRWVDMMDDSDEDEDDDDEMSDDGW